MAFLGIKIPTATARLLSNIEVPGENIGVHEMHVTILLFDDNWPITEFAKSLEAAYDIISDTKPFTATVKEITCFPAREGKPFPIIAPVVSDELHDLYKKLKRKFNKKDIEFDKKFKDYKPHITLSYDDKELKKFKIEPVEFVVQELVLFGGDQGDSRIFTTFPLKSPDRKKNSMLLQKIDAFYKMAQNSE